MMTFGMSAELYDVAAVHIIYAKLLDKLVEDFLTRADAQKMMLASNLSVNTKVNTILSGAAGPVPVTGTGTGVGNGQVVASYQGDYTQRSAGTYAMVAKRQAEKLAGTASTEGTLEAIDVVAGGGI